MARFYKAFILFFVLPYILYPQSQDIKFEHLSIAQGLSLSWAVCILQDSRGFMWFGTEEGLNKYDGYKFTIFRHDPENPNSLSHNAARSLFEDKSGNLWIGTTGGGIDKFDLETEQFSHFAHDPDNLHSLSNNNVSAIDQDQSGALWIGTDNGLDKLNPNTGRFTRYNHDPDNPNSLSNNKIWTLYQDKSGILWIGTDGGGLNKIDPVDEKISSYKHAPDSPYSLYKNLVFSIYEDESGVLWLGTGYGLGRFDREKEQFKYYRPEPVHPSNISSNVILHLFESNSGEFWLGTFSRGLIKFNRDSEEFTIFQHEPGNSKSIGSNSIFSIYQDRSGQIWLATLGDGINKFNPKAKKIDHYQHNPVNPRSLSDNYIWPIFEDKSGVLWIGTKNGGLNKFNRKKGIFTHYTHDPGNPKSLSHNSVWSICEDPSGYLWIGTTDGLNKLDPKTGEFSSYIYDARNPNSLGDNWIRAVYADKSGVIWIGTQMAGLDKFNPQTGKFTHYRHDPDNNYSISNNPIQFIYEDKSGILWVGTYGGGLNKFNRDKEQFTLFQKDPNNPNSISDNNVFSIYESPESEGKVLWVGTDGGLNKFDGNTGQFTHFTTKDGLPNDKVLGILQDEQGNLWLSTNNGLSKFNPENETFRNYNKNDGLQSSEFHENSYCKSRKGEMIFGGINGFNVFHPDSIKDNTYIPPVIFTDFQIFNKHVFPGTNSPLNKSISETKQIILSHEQSIFSFEFAALDFTAPLNNKYAYKMEGVDPDWVYTDASRRFATYTQLSPGEYVFRVKGSNNDGLWNEEGTSIKIIITPPWWRTTWAYSVYILFFALTLYALRTYDMKRQRLKHDFELEHLHKEKLEEVDRLKSRFFANISHEFRTPLTLIEGPVKQMLSGEFKGSIKEQYKVILRNSGRLLKLINQLLDLSKLESGKLKLQTRATEMISLTNELVQAFESLAVRKKITLKFNSETDSQEVYVDVDKFEKIINNLLSNAFRFTPEQGTIEVMVNFEKHPPESPLNRGDKSVSPLIKGTKGGCLKISISNTGPGIPPDKIDKIFDRFYQIDDSYTKDEEGTGIGLALTKELVELHHSTIAVECRGMARHAHNDSEPNAITTFTVILPLGKDHLREDEIAIEIPDPDSQGILAPKSSIEYPETSIQHPEASIQHPTSKIKYQKTMPLVLVVEDNADLRQYIRRNMKDHYQIIEAENGEEGLTIATDKIPDLIISDVMMPKMDGFEFCAKIKTDERTSHIPVILITARAAQEDKLEGLETGADDYITKPFDNKELLIRVKNLIDQRRKLRERFAKESNFLIDKMAHTSTDEKFINRVMDIISQNISESKFNIENLSEKAGLSRMHLHRKILGLFGQSPGDFLRTIRLKRGAELLKEKTGNISEIAYEVGFDSPAYFSNCFRQQFGLSPSEYVKNLQSS